VFASPEMRHLSGKEILQSEQAGSSSSKTRTTAPSASRGESRLRIGREQNLIAASEAPLAWDVDSAAAECKIDPPKDGFAAANNCRCNLQLGIFIHTSSSHFERLRGTEA